MGIAWIREHWPNDLLQVENLEHRHVPNIAKAMPGTIDLFGGSQKYGAMGTGDNAASWEHSLNTGQLPRLSQLTGIGYYGTAVAEDEGAETDEREGTVQNASLVAPF